MPDLAKSALLSYKDKMYTLEELQQKVNEAILAFPADIEPRGLYAPIDYVLSLGGKRIRPILVLMAYNLYREDIEKAMMPAVGLETYHNFTLLHDDLMDRADVRRGMPTVHKKWNDNTAILSGDNMLVMAMQRVSTCDPSHVAPVVRLFTQTAIEIDEGQQYDMDFESRVDVTEEEYIEMIRLKTSVLLACALQMGAILADAPQADQQALYCFGEKLGLAFQLQDDYLDVYGDFRTFGKKIGGDILCNKKTYMLINALRLADEKQRSVLRGWIDNPNPDPEAKIAAVTRLYDEIGIPAMALDRIDGYFVEAMQALAQVNLPESQKAALRQMAERLMNRKS